MKNRTIYLTILLALLAGFALAWWLKPVADPSTHEEAASPIDQTYTCSMHPQIRQEGPGQCPICGMDLIPVGANSSTDPLVLEMTEAAVQLAAVQTTRIGSAALNDSKELRLSGKIKADERLISSLVSQVPGRIEKLYVSFEGEQVNAGQKVAELYSPPLITAQQELLEALKLQDLNPQLLEAARNKLRYWKFSEASIAGIEAKGTIQETFPIFAERSGIVTQKRVAVGDYLQPGTPLFELQDLRKVWVLFDAYEADLSNIAVGDRVQFSTPALPGEVFNATITFIDPVIDPITRVASLRTEVNNPQRKLKPEMLVSGMLKNDSQDGSVLSVPTSAVLWTGTRSVVYVKLPEAEIPSFQYREIEIGERLGAAYQVLSGLEAGEEVVTNGSFTIDAAAQLNNQASMMNKMVQVTGQETPPVPDYRESTPDSFKTQLARLADRYLEIKNALVQTNAALAAKAAGNYRQALDQMEMGLLQGDAHLYWMGHLKALENHSSQIAASSDVEVQRRAFSFLSEAMIQNLEAFGTGKTTFYVQHCPMANEDEGADWLSEEKKIQNPYFGDQMLTCGTIKKELP